MQKVAETVLFANGLYPRSLNAASAIGPYVGFGDNRQACAVVIPGSIPDGKTVTLEIFQATDEAGTDSKALAGASFTVTASGEAKTDGVGFVEFDPLDLDKENGFVTFACKVTTDADIVAGAVIVFGESRFTPENEGVIIRQA